VLSLPDHWVWDSWIADAGDQYHLFFLKAPRTLGNPGLRHTAASIGHATSADLISWMVHDDALRPARDGWDDLALWTGSVIQGDDGIWRLYYTALSTDPGHGARDQRIGIAESDDLFDWRRVSDGPHLRPDPRWYQTIQEDRSASDTWRDPFVFKDPGGDGWHMLICARADGAPRFKDAVLGHARSADMLSWQVQPPLSAPAGFGQLEVPEVRVVATQPVLLFTCHPDEQSREQVARFGPHSTWYALAASVTGPWDVTQARPFTGEPELFAASLVQQRDGSWVLLGFRNQEPDGVGSFEILDPIPVSLEHGELRPA
jgi:beta-fructofuranosidase